MYKILLKPLPNNLCIYLLICLGFMLSCAPENPTKTLTPKIDIPYIEAQLNSQIQMYDTSHTKVFKRVTAANEVNHFSLNEERTKKNLIAQCIYNINNDNYIMIGSIKMLYFNFVAIPICCSSTQNSSLFYDSTNNKVKLWIPFEWAQYVSELDTNHIKMNCTQHLLSMSARSNTLQEKELWGFSGTYPYPIFSTDQLFIYYSISDSLPYLAYSLKGKHHFEMLQQIFETATFAKKVEIDTLLQLLQNQYRYDHNRNNRCFLIDTVMNTDAFADKKRMSIDKRNMPIYKSVIWQGQECPEIRERIRTEYLPINAEKITSLQFILPDGYIENLDEIAEYAKRTKPAFIYYKPFARNYSSPYNYFIFYYIDFIPFMPPRLRDMQVVFPRRFGLS
jgi:hypothetical protein